MTTHIRGMKVKTRAEFMPDDNLFLVHCQPDNGEETRPDSEFYVRLLPCGEHPGEDHYRSSVLFFSNLAPNMLKKAMDIGVEVLSSHGFLEDDDAE